MRALVVSVLVLLALPAAAAAASPSTKIVGGSDAVAGEFPAQAFLQSSVGDCGATLVAPTKVLTAAHCVFGGEAVPDDFLTCLGEVDLDNCESEDIYGVSAVERHASYNPATNENDVAMLTLAEAAPFTPLRLVDAGEQSLWADGETATIVGWGTTSSGGSPSSTLKKANVPMTSDAQCASAYDDYYAPGFDGFFAATMVCAGDGVHDTCQGDSGGPLMVQDGSELVLAGVTSFGEGCADPDYPGVYARVGADPLNAWVRARISPGAQETATQPVTPAQQPTAPDLTVPVLRTALPGGQRLRRALKNGLKWRFRCSEGCRLNAKLTVARKTARRLHMSRVMARGSANLAAESRKTVAIKFSRRARSRLAGARRVTLTLTATAVDASGNKFTAIRRYTLRR